MGIWKGNKQELIGNLKKLEEKEKGIELESENEKKILENVFLNLEGSRMEDAGRTNTR